MLAVQLADHSYSYTHTAHNNGPQRQQPRGLPLLVPFPRQQEQRPAEKDVERSLLQRHQQAESEGRDMVSARIVECMLLHLALTPS